MVVEQVIAIGASIISIGLTGIASGYQMKKLGILSEKVFESSSDSSKRFFTPSLVFTVFAETPAIYGLLVSILILLNLGSNLSLLSAKTMLLASIAVGVPAFSAAFGIGLVSSSALAAISKKPGLFGKSLVFVIFPETIAIYGLLIALLLLMGAGVIGSASITSVEQFDSALLATIIIAVIGAVMAYFLGQLGVHAVKALVNDDKVFVYSLVIVALPESIAIYGLLVSIMILNGAGVF